MAENESIDFNAKNIAEFRGNHGRVGGDERDVKYAEQARRYPGFAGYEKKTTRKIPVVALTPVR